MASSSCLKQGSVPMNNIHVTPEATYEAVVADAKLFMATLERLHSRLGTKFMVPIIGGKDLDLHKLFKEVTSRGGISKIVNERRWKEVTATFVFPPTATNASFVLRKYYFSLLKNYEQLYFFRSNVQTPPPDILQNPSAAGPGLVIRPPQEPLALTYTPQPRINSSDLPGECLRSLKQAHKEDDAKVKRAFQTLLTYMGNVAKNPDEEKFRKIRLTNQTFQDRVGSLRGGIEFMELCGFEKMEGGEFLFLPRDKIDPAIINSAGTELNSAINNPFFGVL
ncbi:hypothetical protein DY000_02044392 [Brassica cretica]|uniref:ARID domain-containing protein n=1 Tax=Brassica cretica TaxID=69181 RepID=A0ABQ7F1Z4_BRACR|nr:hypothetical protein DY000_02044392 [Brassica cretica]